MFSVRYIVRGIWRRKVVFSVFLICLIVLNLAFINPTFLEGKDLNQNTFLNLFKARPLHTFVNEEDDHVTQTGRGSSVYGDRNCRGNPFLYSLQKELLTVWVNLTRQHNIEYFVGAGALLGIVRNGDMIPWDFDIDVYVHKKYFPILEGLSEKRNFNPGDWKIHMVVQPDYNHNVTLDKQMYITCDGRDIHGCAMGSPVSPVVANLCMELIEQSAISKAWLNSPKNLEKVTPNYIVDPCTFRGPIGRLFKGTWVELWQLTDDGEFLVDPIANPTLRYKVNDVYPLKRCKYIGIDTWCPRNSVKILQNYFKTETFEPDFVCRNGTWVNRRDGTTLAM